MHTLSEIITKTRYLLSELEYMEKVGASKVFDHLIPVTLESIGIIRAQVKSSLSGELATSGSSEHEIVTRKRKADTQLVTSSKKVITPHDNAIEEVFTRHDRHDNAIEEVITRHDNEDPIKDGKEVLADRVLDSVLSSDTLLQCVSIINEWRNNVTGFDIAHDLDSISWKTGDEHAFFLFEETQHNWGSSLLGLMLHRLSVYRFATFVDETRAGFRSDNTSILSSRDPTIQKTLRNRFNKELAFGRKLVKICGNFGPGLLIFLPKSDSALRLLSSTKTEEIAGLLESKKDQIQDQCRIGFAIQSMFNRDNEFRFEYEGNVSLDDMNQAELPKWLLSVVYPKFDAPTVDETWSRPSLWTLAWPTDPTSYTQPEKLQTLLDFQYKPNYRIITRNGLREIIARGRRDQPAFRQGEILEEFVGEIKPLGWAQKCKMTVTFVRPDFGTVCQIHYGRKNNWTRLIGYDDDPTVELVVLPRQGRMQMVFRALRDIQSGVAITVDHKLCTTCNCQHCRF